MTDDNQDQPGLPVPTDAGEINNELEGLQEEMADTRGPYWSGPRAERKQARYRQLVEAQERLEGGADGSEEAEPVRIRTFRPRSAIWTPWGRLVRRGPMSSDAAGPKAPLSTASRCALMSWPIWAAPPTRLRRPLMGSTTM